MPKSLEQLRREAKALLRSARAGDAQALTRFAAVFGDTRDRVHADALHVIAREAGHDSWPKLKATYEVAAMDRAARLDRLRKAVFFGQRWMIEELLAADPTLADADFGLQVAFYRRDAVAAALARDPGIATRLVGVRRPILHLAYSRYHQVRPDLSGDMIAIAEALLTHGADVNDGYAMMGDGDHLLSALYGAVGHGDNMVLGQWLLDHGADPNDGESLYHATELGHHDGLRMLLQAGADPKGTNALLRAMDFHDHAAVELLLTHGARADDFDDRPVGGETPWVVPALHQAARRMCDRRMIDLLLAHGADPNRRFEGATAYGFARVFGNRPLAEALEAAGAETTLTADEALMARAAEGQDTPGQFIDPAKLPEAYRNIVRVILHLPGKLDHVKRLVALGLEHDRPDAEGLTPVQLAGWEGLPEVMGYFLSLGPDLAHVNGYGGNLVTTIIHGSENAPDRATRDHIGCMRLALEQGAALGRNAVEGAMEPEMAAFLADWAEAHPGQVVAQIP